MTTEARPDLVPPCCAACARAGVASVTWDEADGWRVTHGAVVRAVASGAEAAVMLGRMHYERAT